MNGEGNDEDLRDEKV